MMYNIEEQEVESYYNKANYFCNLLRLFLLVLWLIIKQ